MSIYELEPGQRGVVTGVNVRGCIRQRLLDMGLMPESKVEMVRVAPTGTPVWVKVEGAQLALRRTEAQAVLVKPSE